MLKKQFQIPSVGRGLFTTTLHKSYWNSQWIFYTYFTMWPIFKTLRLFDMYKLPVASTEGYSDATKQTLSFKALIEKRHSGCRYFSYPQVVGRNNTWASLQNLKSGITGSWQLPTMVEAWPRGGQLAVPSSSGTQGSIYWHEGEVSWAPPPPLATNT